MQTKIVLAFSILLAVLCLPQYCRAEGCPPGYKLDHLERTETEVRTYCVCQPDHELQGRQCVFKLPAVPSMISPVQEAQLKMEIAKLSARKKRLEQQLEFLNKLRSQQDQYLQEMGELREQVLYDSVGDLLGLASTEALLAKIPGLRPGDVLELSSGLRLLKTEVDAVASAAAGADRERARQKALGSAGTLMAVVARVLPMGSDEDRRAFSAVISASTEILKVPDPDLKNTTITWPRVAAALDSFAAIVGAVVPEVGGPRRIVHAAGDAIVVWRIQTDKESIQEALVSSQRAKLAAEQRLADTEASLQFYQLELRKAEALR